MAKEKKSYQELKAELDLILRDIQHEDTDIDEAVVLYEKGQKVLKELQDYLVSIAEKADLEIKIKST